MSSKLEALMDVCEQAIGDTSNRAKTAISMAEALYNVFTTSDVESVVCDDSCHGHECTDPTTTTTTSTSSDFEPRTPPSIRMSEASDTTQRVNRELTPITRSRFDAMSPDSREEVKDHFKLDPSTLKKFIDMLSKHDEEVRTIYKKYDMSDGDYTLPMEQRYIGVVMENYICANGKCPLCQNVLYKYRNSNMPAVDLICSRAVEHIKNNTCFLFQVKTMISYGYGEKYFDKEYVEPDFHCKITVGSRKIGEIVNGITTCDEKKFICPGYICVCLQPVYTHGIRDHNHYILRKECSFVVVPNYNLTSTRRQLYYKYLDEPGLYGHSVITCSITNTDLMDISTCLTGKKCNAAHYKNICMKEAYIHEQHDNPARDIVD
jgi:hypothetical protein